MAETVTFVASIYATVQCVHVLNKKEGLTNSCPDPLVTQRQNKHLSLLLVVTLYKFSCAYAFIWSCSDNEFYPQNLAYHSVSNNLNIPTHYFILQLLRVQFLNGHYAVT